MKQQLDQLFNALARKAEPSSDFDLNFQTPSKFDALRAAAVLVAFKEDNGKLSLILTKRASGLRHHPGQIAFPGGKVEDSDTSDEAASLREAEEEIGLAPSSVEIIGSLPTHTTVTGFAVRPFVGLVRAPFTPLLDEGEVAEVIYAPFDHVLDQSKYLVQGRNYFGQFRKYYTIPYGPHYIWGATARMTYGLAKRVLL
ncbi:CoA pyrophosphatase [Lentibacter algarum]|uniref:NUDIX hydrolase n=1 Tax=Lentibacter algarum TaxID=576131 RepID=UPI001C06FFC8|nr:CoA pyrophosphatase [Lentibacter algarum]MBU2981089.1 CoA pyrophosphatase [Lentibacter algarum]